MCRPTRGLSSWSAHAYGLAIDLDAAAGFHWGGAWRNPTDRMHFSVTGE